MPACHNYTLVMSSLSMKMLMEEDTVNIRATGTTILQIVDTMNQRRDLLKDNWDWRPPWDYQTDRWNLFIIQNIIVLFVYEDLFYSIHFILG